MRALVAGLLLTIMMAATSPVLAQITLPGAAVPGRDSAVFTQSTLTPRSDIRAATNAASTEFTAPITGVSVVLNAVEISGSTIFSAADFQALYQDYLGVEVEVGIIFEIADRATALYRGEGYILSQVIVPPQEIEDGVVKLTVIEGYIDEVIIDGTLGSKRDLVAGFGRKIQASRPLKADVLEHYLLLAGDLAGLTVESVFTPSSTNAGASTLIIKAEYDWFEASVSAVNSGSDEVGPWLANGEMTFNSLLGLHERIIFKGGVAGELRELQVGEIQVSAPVGYEGTSVFGRLSLSSSEPGNGLEIYGIKNDSTRISVGAKHPLIRSRRRNLFVGVQFDWNDLKSGSVTFGKLSEDNLRVVRANLEYDFVDTTLGASMPAVTTLQATFSQGLGIFGATTSTSPFKTRTNTSGTFTAVSAEVQRNQKLGNSGFGVLLAARGQFTNAPLLASEEFGLGGSDYGRGYDPSTLVGDRGLAGKIELQYSADGGIFGNILNDYQLYAFVDGGVVENINFDGIGNSQFKSLWSAGGGVRLGFIQDIDMDLTLAYRGTDSNSVQNLDDPRWRALVKIAAKL